MKPEYFSRCQVETPPDVVQLLWSLALEARGNQIFKTVLDLGAGDGRFAQSPNARYEKYIGVECDKKKVRVAKLPSKASIVYGDAMRWRGLPCGLAIGNPPFIRHGFLTPRWREETIQLLREETGYALQRNANAYVMFLLKALLRTESDGLVVQLVPFEWVTRPSARNLRAFIEANKWGVKVYRFDTDIFPSVLTTASIAIIDKRVQTGAWEFGEIRRNGAIRRIDSPSGTSKGVLPYARRNEAAYALRGLSPGGQEIFVLTEEQRLRFSLRKRRDVVPCVTSLRPVNGADVVLDLELFKRAFVDAGARCWLIRTDREKRSPELWRYLESVDETWKNYTTCTRRGDWAKYVPHPPPGLLVSSGFVGRAPKVLVNEIQAVAVGSVYGVFAAASGRKLLRAAERLRRYDFRPRLVHHSNNLKKLEVRQLNAVLNRLIR